MGVGRCALFGIRLRLKSSPIAVEGSPVAGRNLHRDLLDRIGAAIVHGERAPGETFTTADIEQAYDVSRSVAREAVRVLENLRMVRSSPRVGSTVLPSDEWNQLAPEVIRWRMEGPDKSVQLRSLTELRAGIEPAAARFAARRATPEQIRTLRRAAERMADLSTRVRGDDPEFLAEDILFHTTLLEATANELFGGLRETLAACLQGRNEAGLTPVQVSPENLTNHLLLADAVGRRDEAEAARLAFTITGVVRSEID